MQGYYSKTGQNSRNAGDFLSVIKSLSGFCPLSKKMMDGARKILPRIAFRKTRKDTRMILMQLSGTTFTF